MKKILYVLLGMFIAFYAFAVVCMLNPELSETIGRLLNADSDIGSDEVMTARRTPDRSEPDIPTSDSEPDLDGNEDNRRYPEGEQAAEESAVEASDDNQGVEEGISSGYIPPEQSQIVIPEAVSGRNGYRQVQDEQEQVDETEAERLRTRLDTGHTGDGLEFDARYYPYYAMLNEKGQHLYRQIYANGQERYRAFAPVEDVTTGELRNIFSAVYNDHPELFWMETAYSGKYVRNGQCIEIDLQFNETARDLDSAKKLFDENAEQILRGVRSLPDNYEKEKAVHDALLERISYNMGAGMNQSAYSALVNGQTVCAGYARAFQYLLQELEIPCYYCTGFAGESHAWNIVMLDDGFYNVDTTWDDTGNGTYDYFNKTDADYASSHIRRELSVYLPPCNGQAYRNLEPEEEPETDTEDRMLRSLADTGLTQEQVFTDMQGYYVDCYGQMISNGRGRYVFYSVLEGEELFDEWYQGYQGNDYRQAYMENAMTEMGAAACEITLEAEPLQDERYLIRHELYVR